MATYTEDWCSSNIPIWTGLLGKYKDKPDIRFLEIGSYQGRSVIWMLENILTHETSRAHCIDTFQGSDEHTDAQKKNIFEIFTANTEPFKEKVSVHVGKSFDILKKMPDDELFDIIYIDGDHKAQSVLQDAVLAWPLLKTDGILIFDDYGSGPMHHYERLEDYPRLAINGFCNSQGDELQVLHRGYQLVVQKVDRMDVIWRRYYTRPNPCLP